MRTRFDPEPLTSREREVVKLLVKGMTNREIAAALNVSPETVHTYIGHILRKTGFGARRKLVAHVLGAV